MRLPKLALDNCQFSIMIIILLMLLGVVSTLTMPRSEDPQVSPPGANVVVIYPGASPEDLEELVVDPIEEELNEIEDVKELSSVIRDGLAVINIEFDASVDLDDKYSELTQKVTGIREDLPDEILSLDISKWSISDVSILQIGLVSEEASYRELEHEAEVFKDELEKIGGVKKVETYAYPEQEVRVSVDLSRLAQYGISLGEVERALRSENTNIPGGYIDINDRRLTIETSGSYESLDQIRRTVVRASSDMIVHLEDIADVSMGYEDAKHLARVNGERAVFVTVNQKERTNVFSIIEDIKPVLVDFASSLPSTIDMVTVVDQSESVSKRVNGFFSNLLQGLALVGLVILLAANLRTSIIVILAIPMSLAIGIGFVDLSGYGLEQMSIAGLVIALGLLVDNAIVVTENIQIFMRKGYSPLEAAVKGTAQIGWAVTSSTVTTLLAFVPIMMLPDITGDFIRSMPTTVVYTLSASLVVSLIFTPFLVSRFVRPSDAASETLLRRHMNNVIEGSYARTLQRSLRRPRTVLAIALAVFVGSLGLFPLIGISFFPKAEKPQFIVNIDAPEGSSLAYTDSLAQEVEELVGRFPEIRTIAANVGRGNPRIYYNVMPRNEMSNHAQLFVELHDWDMHTLERLIDSLRAELDTWPGAKFAVKEFEQGPPIEAPIAIRIIGDNLDVLKDLSRDLERMIAETPGTINIDNPLGTSRTDLKVDINRSRAAMLGVPIAEIDRTIRAGVAGWDAGSFRDPDGKEYKIILRLPGGDSMTVEDMSHIYVASAVGTNIPLAHLAKLEFKSSPLKINHYDLNRNVTVTADVESGRSVNATTLEIVDKLKTYDWPKGYRWYVGGELESREESFGGLGRALVIALVAILAVLVLQFRSFVQPLIVFSAIPLAIIGSILALLATGNTFSFTAFVGISSLIGIVINNSIILVDYTNQLRAEGVAKMDALFEAGRSRFTPIILTTATTIGGLLPLTLTGGTMWAPMGWAIIGGLAMSTFLTLVVVPVLYKLFTPDERLV